MDNGKVYAYIEELYGKKKLTQQQYSESTELENYGQPVDDDVARMLQIIIMAAKPQKVLEIGTSIGFSTVMMAEAMKHYGGKIVTVEFDGRAAEQAVANFERRGLKEQIEVVVGDARVVVAAMDQEFDLIFQDVGDKELYAELLDSCLRLLKPGGLLIAEDVLYPAFDLDDPDCLQMCEPLQAFNKAVVECPRFESTLLPIGDGLMVAVKK